MHTYKLYVQHILQPLLQEVLHWENGSARGKHHLPNHCLLLCRSSGMCEHTVQTPKHPLPRSHYNMAAAGVLKYTLKYQSHGSPFAAGRELTALASCARCTRSTRGPPRARLAWLARGARHARRTGDTRNAARPGLARVTIDARSPSLACGPRGTCDTSRGGLGPDIGQEHATLNTRETLLGHVFDPLKRIQSLSGLLLLCFLVRQQRHMTSVVLPHLFWWHTQQRCMSIEASRRLFVA
jgi:hypothetical protein